MKIQCVGLPTMSSTETLTIVRPSSMTLTSTKSTLPLFRTSGPKYLSDLPMKWS